MKKLKIVSVVGTRPEIIKLAPLYQALQRRPGVQTDTLWTGQHGDLGRGQRAVGGGAGNGGVHRVSPGFRGRRRRPTTR